MVASDVETWLHEAVALEAKLSHVVPSVVAEEQKAARFEHLRNKGPSEATRFMREGNVPSRRS